MESCPGCKTQFVAWNRDHCPECGRGLPVPLIRIEAPGLQRRMLLKRDLAIDRKVMGLRGDSPLVTLRREGEKAVFIAHGSCRIRNRWKYLAHLRAGQTFSLAFSSVSGLYLSLLGDGQLYTAPTAKSKVVPAAPLEKRTPVGFPRRFRSLRTWVRQALGAPA